MFPLGDDDTQRRSAPVVTVILIALNLLLFFVELNGGQAFIQQWAFVPRRFGLDPSGQAPTIGIVLAFVLRGRGRVIDERQ